MQKVQATLAVGALEVAEPVVAKRGAIAVLTLLPRSGVIRADGRPVAYLIDSLPDEILKPGILPSEFRGSVLDFLLAAGSDLQLSRAAISATNATAEVAKPLEIQRDDVLLRFESQLYDSKGHVMDYSVSYFIPGYFHFHVNRRVGRS